MSRAKKTEQKLQPVMKVRLMIIAIAAVSLLTAGPLLSVWKQVYVKDSAVQREHMIDSLRVLSKRVESLQTKVSKLSEDTRIELLAKETFGLQYPSADQIQIIQESRSSFINVAWLRNMLLKIGTFFPT